MSATDMLPSSMAVAVRASTGAIVRMFYVGLVEGKSDWGVCVCVLQEKKFCCKRGVIYACMV